MLLVAAVTLCLRYSCLVGLGFCVVYSWWFIVLILLISGWICGCYVMFVLFCGAACLLDCVVCVGLLVLVVAGVSWFDCCVGFWRWCRFPLDVFACDFSLAFWCLLWLLDCGGCC